MGKDRVDLIKWTNEDYAKEYSLIKEKKSKLPATQRKLIVDLVEATNKETK
jgi:hypothetical protein